MNTITALNSLGDFTAREKKIILSEATLLTVPARWAPISEGTAPDKVYLILDGEATVQRQSQTIARLGAGDLMGETALATNRLRNATVVAETPLQVLHFTRASWADLTKRIPALNEAVNDVVLQRA